MKITGVHAAESVRRAQNAGLIKIIGKPVTVQRKAEEYQSGFEFSSSGGIILNTI